MSTPNYQDERDYKVILAWIILALQITGLLLLLLFGRDRLAALMGGEATPVAEAVASPVAATEEPAVDAAATQAIMDAAATAEAEAVVTEAAATVEAEAAAATADAQAARQPAVDFPVIPPEEVTVDPGVVAPEWLAELVEGTPAGETDEGAGMPPHLLLTFPDPENPDAEAAAPDTIDLNRPQVRIIPIAALLAMLERRGDQASRAALEDLRALLEQQPDAAEAAIPDPPILSDVAQNFVAQADYKQFGGGEGIGYLTNITGEDVVPVTNESGLVYVYQGLTDDGEQYVFMSWPVDAAFLPETAADAADAAAMIESDRVAYFDTLREQVETAADADLTPSVSLLDRVLASLSIRGQTAAVDEGATTPATAEGAAGITWTWTGIISADGEETAVENPQNYSLVLWPDGTYNIKANCNVGGGAFIFRDEGSIRFQPGPLTRALCPPGSRDAEFVESLLAARAAGFNESGDMVLELSGGSSMILANVGQVESEEVAEAGDQPEATDAGLTGVALQWPGFTNAAGESMTTDNPENYVLTLLPDGTFNVVADCNVGGGSYTFNEDGTLQLGPIRITRVACPEGSQGDEFLAFLEGVTNATVAEDGSVTMMTADGSSATFISGEAVAESGDLETVTAEEDPLIGSVWQWTGFTSPDGAGDLTIDDPESYLLLFLPDGDYSIKADCNIGRGSYTREDGVLTMEPAALTLALCPPGSLSNEYVQFLVGAQSYAITDDGSLELTLDDGGVMTFANGGPPAGEVEAAEPEEQPAADDAGLTGIVLQWPGFTNAAGETITVDDPENYTLILFPDGTYSARADCNVANGVFTYGEDGAIILLPGVQTLALCPEGSQSDVFLGFLSSVESLTVGDDGNVTMNTTDGSSATFVNLGEVETAAEDATESAAQPTPATDPLLTTWQWTHFRDAKQDFDVTGTYTITFNADGTAAVVADCNTGSGSYSLNGEELNISILAVTLAACPSGSLDDTFVEFLNQAGTFAISDGMLTIELMADGGAMTFVATQ
jgi:heat shock protein HslJ